MEFLESEGSQTVPYIPHSLLSGTADTGNRDITFLYKLVKGAALRSHGSVHVVSGIRTQPDLSFNRLNVARIAGIPAEVYGEAYEKAHELERNTQDRQVANSSKRLLDALESDGKTENAADAGDALLHMLDVMLHEQ